MINSCGISINVSKIFNQENAVENAVRKTSAILSGYHCVKFEIEANELHHLKDTMEQQNCMGYLQTILRLVLSTLFNYSFLKVNKKVVYDRLQY